MPQGLPAYTRALHTDPELALGNSLSKHMWTSNPG